MYCAHFLFLLLPSMNTEVTEHRDGENEDEMCSFASSVYIHKIHLSLISVFGSSAVLKHFDSFVNMRGIQLDLK